ncbi:MAG: cupin domain-containing protein [Hyphomonas sp.]|nr:cupin domain-containing protein [Hyphomonas sp.]
MRASRQVPPAAQHLIETLKLAPHPEGGFYRETFRDAAADASGRSRSTAIYFLLLAGEISRWHTVDAVEMWHWYAGAPLELRLAEPGCEAASVTLGFDPAAGILPQAVVPQGWWQQARSLGDWTLVGCTVAPGFNFEGFRLAPEGGEPPLP